MPTTTYFDGAPKPTKPFAWSYSRIRNHENCPRKHLEVDLLKRVPMDASPALEEGQRTHDAIAAYLKNGTPLPGTMRDFYPQIRRVVGQDPPGVQWLVEENMAIRRDMVGCGQFEPGVWMRAKVDFAKVYGKVGAVVDWKTGKILEDLVQLALMAACMFGKFPALERVRTQYCWLAQNAVTHEDFERSQMSQVFMGIMPRIDAYEHAYKTGDFPPRPSGLCVRYCQVASCRYYQKGTQGA